MSQPPNHNGAPAGSPTRVAGVVLAAGGSSRFGRPKQLLEFRGQTLIRRAVTDAIAADLQPVVVVLGAHAEQLRDELSGLHVECVVNSDWRSGVGGSIRCGMRALPAELDAVVLTLCDQPLVTADILRRLVEAHRATAAPVVAAEYAGTVGVPALFGRNCFGRLAVLSDGEGAKGLIRAAGDAVRRLPFPDGIIDVDSPADYERLLAQTLASFPEPRARARETRG